jgi:hypothetical protein
VIVRVTCGPQDGWVRPARSRTQRRLACKRPLEQLTRSKVCRLLVSGGHRSSVSLVRSAPIRVEISGPRTRISRSTGARGPCHLFRNVGEWMVEDGLDGSSRPARAVDVGGLRERPASPLVENRPAQPRDGAFSPQVAEEYHRSEVSEKDGSLPVWGTAQDGEARYERYVQHRFRRRLGWL